MCFQCHGHHKPYRFSACVDRENSKAASPAIPISAESIRSPDLANKPELLQPPRCCYSILGFEIKNQRFGEVATLRAWRGVQNLHWDVAWDSALQVLSPDASKPAGALLILPMVLQIISSAFHNARKKARASWLYSTKTHKNAEASGCTGRMAKLIPITVNASYNLAVLGVLNPKSLKS